MQTIKLKAIEVAGRGLVNIVLTDTLDPWNNKAAREGAALCGEL
jgi:hypothetical protein